MQAVVIASNLPSANSLWLGSLALAGALGLGTLVVVARTRSRRSGDLEPAEEWPVDWGGGGRSQAPTRPPVPHRDVTSAQPSPHLRRRTSLAAGVLAAALVIVASIGLPASGLDEARIVSRDQEVHGTTRTRPRPHVTRASTSTKPPTPSVSGAVTSRETTTNPPQTTRPHSGPVPRAESSLPAPSRPRSTTTLAQPSSVPTLPAPATTPAPSTTGAPIPSTTAPPAAEPPHVQGDSFTVDSGRDAQLDVLANDDAGTAKLIRSSLQIVASPSHATSFSVRKNAVHYQSVDGFAGPDSFDYRLCDSAGLCATAHVTLQIVAHRVEK